MGRPMLRRLLLLPPVAALATTAPAALATTTVHTVAHAVTGTPFEVDVDQGGPGHTTRQQTQAVADGLVHLQDFAHAQLGVGVQRKTIVELTRTDLCDGDQVPGQMKGATSGHHICLFMNRSWPSQLASLIVAHEAVHVLQSELGCSAPSTGVPDWMVEGMAEDLAMRAMDPSRSSDAM